MVFFFFSSGNFNAKMFVDALLVCPLLLLIIDPKHYQ